MDINVKVGNYILNCRAVGIIIRNNRILLQKKINDKYWALPGGKIQVGETGEDAIKREMNEELNIDSITIKRVHSISENFFNIGIDKYHQYIFSYIIDIDRNSYIFNKDEFISEDDNSLIYKWFDLDGIDTFFVKPDYLVKLLKDINNNEIIFISNREV